MTAGNTRQEKWLFGARVLADSCIAQLGVLQLLQTSPFPFPNLNETRIEMETCTEQHQTEEMVVWRQG